MIDRVQVPPRTRGDVHEPHGSPWVHGASHPRHWTIRTASKSSSRSVRYRADTLAKCSLNRTVRLRASQSYVPGAISTVNYGVPPVAISFLWNAGPHGGVDSGGSTTMRHL